MSETVTIARLSPQGGAEVRGIDLRRKPDAAEAARLYRAFLDHAVLVVRDQQLAPAEMLAAIRTWGEIFPQHNPRFALPDCPEIHYISNQDRYPDGRRYIPGEGYHTDHSNAAIPPKATVLHAVKLPDRGGDTQFVNMTQALAALDPALRARIENLVAVHVYQSRHSERKLMGLTPTAQQAVPDAVRHPLVRRHPETGQASLYINPIRIEAIEGMAEADALALLDALLSHATRPEFEYRHVWRAGDLVMWDNRCLLHKANGDYDMDQERYLYRAMLREGPPPS